MSLDYERRIISGMYNGEIADDHAHNRIRLAVKGKWDLNLMIHPQVDQPAILYNQPPVITSLNQVCIHLLDHLVRQSASNS